MAYKQAFSTHIYRECILVWLMFNTTRWQLPEQHFRLTLEDDVVMVQYSRTEVFSWPLHISSLESISSSKFWHWLKNSNCTSYHMIARQKTNTVTAHLIIWLLDRKPTVYTFYHKQYINITHSPDRSRQIENVLIISLAKDWQIGWRLGQSV